VATCHSSRPGDAVRTMSLLTGAMRRAATLGVDQAYQQAGVLPRRQDETAVMLWWVSLPASGQIGVYQSWVYRPGWREDMPW
jgi:hypothetical protein